MLYILERWEGVAPGTTNNKAGFGNVCGGGAFVGGRCYCVGGRKGGVEMKDEYFPKNSFKE